MRPGQHQQNRRGRGRNNGGNHQGNQGQGRKGQNPLSRSFESNGPDVKVRGTPAHIAEKYMALARDAQSAGDRVLAENYLQHAEHYNRIIMAYREQFQVPGDQPGGQPRREGFEGMDEGGDEDIGPDPTDEFGAVAAPHQANPSAQQPVEGQGGGGAQGGQPHQHQQRQPYRQDNQRYDRNGNYDRGGDGQNRDRQFRRDGQQNNRFRDRNDRGNRPYNQNGGNGQGDRNYEPRFDRGDRQQDGRQQDGRPMEGRQDHRGDYRPQRSDRPVRVDRPEHERAQQAQPPTVADTPQPPAPIESSLPAFVAAPVHVAPAPVAQPPPPAAAAPRRRERAAEPVASATSEAPEFLRRPVRRPRASAAAPPETSGEPATPSGSGEDSKSD